MLALFLTGSTLNVQSFIGCIMLGGIVVNNAILLVDQAGQLSARGMPVDAALAMGIGEGADAQAPLARAVVGGLLGSTPITLVLIPAIYSLLHPDRDQETA